MQRINGVAGVFIYSDEPDRLTDWYRQNLGVEASNEGGGGISFHEFFSNRTDSERNSRLTWSVFPRGFAGSHRARVVYHVDDIDAVVSQLANGVEIMVREDFDYGRFAWIKDPDDNVVGLFQDLEY